MRKMITTFLAAGAVMAFAAAASAQQQPAPTPAPSATPAQPPAAAPTIQSISIVDIKELPAPTQSKVNQFVSKRSDADLQKLRNSIDGTPEITSALKAKGLSSGEVIAASLDNNGALTLITKKKT